MSAPPRSPQPETPLRMLAEFRFELRKFFQFSEAAALAAGLHPRQYQLLLQVAAADAPPTVAYAAERLGLKHNSTVELVDRSVRQGLLVRKEDPDDRRRTLLRVTSRGSRILGKLAGQHARELTVAAPRLIQALETIRLHAVAEAR